MSGVNPFETMQKIAVRMNELDSADAINEALDEIEYVFEVIPPELQEPAETLIAQLRDKLKNLA